MTSWFTRGRCLCVPIFNLNASLRARSRYLTHLTSQNFVQSLVFLRWLWSSLKDINNTGNVYDFSSPVLLHTAFITDDNFHEALGHCLQPTIIQQYGGCGHGTTV